MAFTNSGKRDILILVPWYLAIAVAPNLAIHSVAYLFARLDLVTSSGQVAIGSSQWVHTLVSLTVFLFAILAFPLDSPWRRICSQSIALKICVVTLRFALVGFGMVVYGASIPAVFCK